MYNGVMKFILHGPSNPSPCISIKWVCILACH